MWHGRPGHDFFSCEWLNHDVNVIRHYAPGCQRIACFVKMEESVLHDHGNARLFHEARTVTCIEVTFDLFEVKMGQSLFF